MGRSISGIRKSQGSVLVLAFVAMVPLVAAIGGFAVDVMHFNDERTALQRSVDAAALAGALAIPTYSGIAGRHTSATMAAAGNEQAVNDALAVASLNIADGRPVFTGANNGITVTATLLDVNGNALPEPSSGAGHPTQCRVSCQMRINSIFAKIFGETLGQVVGAVGTAQVHFRVMPVMLSLTQPGSTGTLQSALAIPNSNFAFDGHENMAWTLTNDPDILSAMDAAAGQSGTPQEIRIGEIIATNWGIKTPCWNKIGTFVGRTFMFPVQDTVANGQGSGLPVKGYLALKIASAADGTATGTIVGSYGLGGAVQLSGGAFPVTLIK